MRTLAYLLDVITAECTGVAAFIAGIVWVMCDAAFHGPGVQHLILLLLVSAWLVIALLGGSIGSITVAMLSTNRQAGRK